MSENKKPTYTTLTHNKDSKASVVSYYKKKYEERSKEQKLSSISR